MTGTSALRLATIPDSDSEQSLSVASPRGEHRGTPASSALYVEGKRESAAAGTSARRALGEQYGSLDPAAAAAQRRVARQSLEPEIPGLLKQREALLKRRFGAGLTPREERALAYVRWKLDMYEDAVTGDQFDELRRMVESEERLARDVAVLVSKLDRTKKKRSP